MVHTGALRGVGSSRAQPRSTQPDDLREPARRYRVSIVRAGEHQVPREEADPVGSLDADASRILPRQARSNTVRYRGCRIENGSLGAHEGLAFEWRERLESSHSPSNKPTTMDSPSGYVAFRKTIETISTRGTRLDSRG